MIKQKYNVYKNNFEHEYRFLSNVSSIGNNNSRMKIGVVLPFVFCQLLVVVDDELVVMLLESVKSFVCNMSDTNGSLKSECRVSFLTDHGAPEIMSNMYSVLYDLYPLFVGVGSRTS